MIGMFYDKAERLHLFWSNYIHAINTFLIYHSCNKTFNLEHLTINNES